ncbi:MAG: acyl-CoA thioesterase [Pyrinomonadaceae bacterium]
MSFSTHINVRFGDCDPAGLVYYPVIFHYFHVAMEEFFAARCGTTYARLMREERIGFPTVKVQAEFLVPMFYGDEIEIAVHVVRVGDSSATFAYSARRKSDATLCARSEQVHVAMNLDTRRAVRVPDNLRRSFAENDA